MLPRGIRLNNPGNIEKTKDNWQGMSSKQEDERFITFIKPVYGLRAIMKILLNYFLRHELKTVRQIINRWAPPHENDTDSYADHVAKILGVNPDKPIDLARPGILIALAKAIALHENGKPEKYKANISPPFWYPDHLYAEAAQMAYGLKPKETA